MIHFTVQGKPVPKGRPRTAVRGGKPVQYTPDRTRLYEQHVGQCAARDGVTMQAGDLGIVIRFYICGGGKLSGDIDNLTKAVMDGLNGMAYEDDFQVKHVYAGRDKCKKGEDRAEVWLMTSEEFDGWFGWQARKLEEKAAGAV